MRAMWKGSLAFGLVNVPVKVYAATEEKDVRFHQVHAADGGRISMVRRCSVAARRSHTGTSRRRSRRPTVAPS